MTFKIRKTNIITPNFHNSPPKTKQEIWEGSSGRRVKFPLTEYRYRKRVLQSCQQQHRKPHAPWRKCKPYIADANGRYALLEPKTRFWQSTSGRKKLKKIYLETETRPFPSNHSTLQLTKGFDDNWRDKTYREIINFNKPHFAEKTCTR